MIIRHNLPALTAFNHLETNNRKLSKTLEKLASGYRINRAADDAAGLAVSEKMRAQITGLQQARINSNNGVSLVQTAEGALTESHAILQRMGELAVESMNGIFEPDDRGKLDAEYQQLLEELDRISESTNFNGIKLLDGSLEAPKPPEDPALPIEPEIPTDPEPPVEVRPPTATIPAGGNITITGDGIYGIADGFTGTITIAAGAKVTLAQAGSTVLKNVTIQCGAGVELTVRDLNIENSEDMNAIDFTGAGNVLKIEGNNQINSTAQAKPAGVIDGMPTLKYVEKALIHAGEGTELTIDGNGTLNSRTADAVVYGDYAYSTAGAVIGGNGKEDAGTITITNATLNLTGGEFAGSAIIGGGAGGAGGSLTLKSGNVSLQGFGIFGAAFGGGGSDALVRVGSNSDEIGYANYVDKGNWDQGWSAGNILILGGTLRAEITNGIGAAIGSGDFGNGGSIRIVGGTVYASCRSGAAIGSGMGVSKACDIEISGGNVTADSYYGAAIGTGELSVLYNGSNDSFMDDSGKVTGEIRISGGKIKATSKGGGAAIGGGHYMDGGKVFISGGDVVVNASGTGAAIGGGAGCYAESIPDFGDGNKNGAPNLSGPYRPGAGADVFITGGTVTVESGWIGGGRDTDTVDFGQDGTLTIKGGKLNAAPFVRPEGESHFDKPQGNPFEPDIPDVPDDPDNLGGLLLQIGTDNAEYDQLRVYIDNMSAKGLMVAGTNILTIENAEEASDWLHYAIGRVSENRGRLGAYQNRLEHNINGLSTAHENMTAAQSRLRDADMAKEMASFTMQNVISQAAQAMLAQANQKPGEVLALLK